jgi:hypothetical protein
MDTNTVTVAVTVTHAPRLVMGGTLDCWGCGSEDFVELPRTLDHYDYMCIACGRHAYPLTETGASA